MFLRLYFLFKTLFSWSIYRDEYAKKLSKSNGIISDLRFIFKCLLETFPAATISMLFFLTIIILSYIIRIIELPFMIYVDPYYFKLPQYIAYFDWVYFMLITVTTVGYGDYVPVTVPGKVIIMFAALMGAMLVSMLVLVLTTMFSLNKN